jgi:sialic acid synthase SpsE
MAKNLPVIASCAATPLENIDKVVKIFQDNNKELALLHCVGEYPTENKNLQLNQIDLLKKRYPNLTIGCSTHDGAKNLDNIKIEIAKGAKIFEKHVGLDDYEGSLNNYSITPKQVRLWLEYAKEAYEACGIENLRYEPTEFEVESLRNLSRGAFAVCDIKEGEIISEENVFFAIPSCLNQMLPLNFVVGKEYKAKCSVKKNSPILISNTL